MVDLGRALPAADDRDRVERLEPLLVRRGSRPSGQPSTPLDGTRARCGVVPDAEHQPPRRGAPRRCRCVTTYAVAVVLDRGHRLPEPDAAEPLGGPAAVVVVLRAQRVERLADVERVEVAGLLEVVEERPARGRVGHRHQVGEERHLQGGVVEQHPGVPGELVAGLEEEPVEVVDRVGEAGQAEVERAEADADEVVQSVIRPPPAAAASSSPTATTSARMPSTSSAVVERVEQGELQPATGRRPWCRRPSRVAALVERAPDPRRQPSASSSVRPSGR